MLPTSQPPVVGKLLITSVVIWLLWLDENSFKYPAPFLFGKSYPNRRITHRVDQVLEDIHKDSQKLLVFSKQPPLPKHWKLQGQRTEEIQASNGDKISEAMNLHTMSVMSGMKNSIEVWRFKLSNLSEARVPSVHTKEARDYSKPGVDNITIYSPTHGHGPPNTSFEYDPHKTWYCVRWLVGWGGRFWQWFKWMDQTNWQSGLTNDIHTTYL